jgi:hypothetical protein
VTLLDHLVTARDNAADAAEHLLAEAGDAPSTAALSMAELYLADLDRCSRLIEFLEARTKPHRAERPGRGARPGHQAEGVRS